MFRITTFTVGDISRSKVARRKGNRVRLFDPVTARMTGWMKSPKATPGWFASMVVTESRESQAAALNAASARIDAQQLATVKAAAALDREEALNAMTVPQLRDLYEAKYGLRPTTRTKKPALVGKLLGA